MTFDTAMISSDSRNYLQVCGSSVHTIKDLRSQCLERNRTEMTMLKFCHRKGNHGVASVGRPLVFYK